MEIESVKRILKFPISLVFSQDHKNETLEHMQKKYRYIVRFFDVTTGADGWIIVLFSFIFNWIRANASITMTRIITSD
jgi:hypothetical protein